MKQKLFIFLFLILLVGVLVGLNAASYVQKQKTPDSEMTPNRSTFHFGATGTNALYALLSETGRRVTRWQDSPSGLAIRKNAPAVFVVIGSVRRDFTDSESDQVLQWVAGGGRLVLIDREPPPGLVSATANWKIRFENRLQVEILSTDPSDQKSMTAGAAAVRPIQPTLFTRGINAIQPSRFASATDVERFADDANRRDKEEKRWTEVPEAVVSTGSVSQIAPVVHFAGREHALLVDAPYGSGSIVFLSDPYIVSNGGIGLFDNAQLAINILSAGDGLIAFDEYHQGYGTNSNRLLQFFEGTPVVAILVQGLLLVGFIFFSQSRRFARALPEHVPDRLSKLEYVSAMAELQQRTRAFDLAIENIYTDFRRRATRFLGIDNYKTSRNEIAKLIAERTKSDVRDVEDTLFKCEDIIHGEPTNKAEVLRLTVKLRELEETLGMTRSARVKK